MELSKKVGYIKGLMAGLEISDTTPEGKVLHAMSDLLEEMADEIETNAEIIDNISLYIDEIEAYDDLLDELDEDEENIENEDDLDDIEAVEYDHDPFADLSVADVTDENEPEDQIGLADLSEDDFKDDEKSEDHVSPMEQSEKVSESLEEEIFECDCPECGTSIRLTTEDLARGTIFCPNCAAKLQFEI
ncbi:MAG: hypothetical protein J6M17_00070 [Ruminococcus sp.]|nr:hypothetical protein [Ruminococcus sp.]